MLCYVVAEPGGGCRYCQDCQICFAFAAQISQDASSVLSLLNSKLQQLMLKIKIQSKIFKKQDDTAILLYTVHSLECENTTSVPASRNESPAPPSSSPGITYPATDDIDEPIENPNPSTQTLSDMLHAAKSRVPKKGLKFKFKTAHILLTDHYPRDPNMPDTHLHRAAQTNPNHYEDAH